MKKFFLSLFIVISLCALSLPDSASAAFYKYVDEQGVVHLTNAPTSSQFVWMMAERGDRSGQSGSRTYNINEYEAFIRAASFKYGVDPLLVKAIVRAESDFDAQAVSRKGARGLMQLMPETATDAGVRDVHDPKANIEGGTRHLSRLLKIFNSKVHLAVAAYNAGENVVLKYNAIPPYSETRAYVKRVLLYYKQYKKTQRL